MRHGPCHPLFGHYAVSLALASLLASASAACTPRHDVSGAGLLRARAGATITFENATTEPVTIYLAERGSEWFVGVVRPGHTAVLPLPAAASHPAGRAFSLVAVPSSARRSVARVKVAAAAPITMEQLPGSYLTAVRWKLAERWLVALPLPGAP